MNRTYLCLLIGCLLVAGAGCRDLEPAPLHPVDLGDGDRALVPLAGEWTSSRMADGTADGVKFREPDVEPEPIEEPEPEPEVEVDPAAAANAAKEAVRALVADVNEAFAENDQAFARQLFVEGQGDGAVAMMELVHGVRDAMIALRDKLLDKLPAKKARIEKLFADKIVMPGDAFDVGALTVKSGTLVVGELAAPEGATDGPFAEFGTTIKFVLLESDEGEKEWYVDFEPLKDPTELQALGNMGKLGFEMMIQALDSGMMPAEEALKAMEEGFEKMMGQQP